MSNLSHYIIEDVNSLYSSIYLSEETEVDEVDAFAGDVYAFVAHSMLHEGYSASGILGFLSTASEDEILEKFGDYNENFIAESTISEEYVNEQVEQLDEFVGAALRVLGAGAKAAKFAKGAKGLAPLSRMGAGLKGAGQALSRVAKQGPRASSVVRAGLSKVKSAAGAGLAKLKGAAGKVGGAALRVLGAGAKAAKFAKGAKGLAPLSRMGAGLKGAGQALSRVAKQGPRASSVVRAGLSKVKSAAGAGLAKLKGAATKVGGAVKSAVTKAAPAVKGALKGAAKVAIPGAAGFALGRATAPKGDSPSKPKTDSAASTSRPQAPAATSKPSTRTTSAPTPPKAETKKPMSKADAMAAWAKANPKLAAAKAERDRTRGTSATTNPMLQGSKSSMPAPKPKEETKKESYDVVLDYLLSEGHADTVEEAHYIMLRLEADHVQEIVESYS